MQPTKTKFLLIGKPRELSKLSLPVNRFHLLLILVCDTSSLCQESRLHSRLNLSNHNQISALSKACFYHIRDLRRIRPYIDLETSSTIATALVHSKLNYCNTICSYLGLSETKLCRLQLIQTCSWSRGSKHQTLGVLADWDLHQTKVHPRLRNACQCIPDTVNDRKQEAYRLVGLSETSRFRDLLILT